MSQKSLVCVCECVWLVRECDIKTMIRYPTHPAWAELHTVNNKIITIIIITARVISTNLQRPFKINKSKRLYFWCYLFSFLFLLKLYPCIPPSFSQLGLGSTEGLSARLPGNKHTPFSLHGSWNSLRFFSLPTRNQTSPAFARLQLADCIQTPDSRTNQNRLAPWRLAWQVVANSSRRGMLAANRRSESRTMAASQRLQGWTLAANHGSEGGTQLANHIAQEVRLVSKRVGKKTRETRLRRCHALRALVGLAETTAARAV